MGGTGRKGGGRERRIEVVEEVSSSIDFPGKHKEGMSEEEAL